MCVCVCALMSTDKQIQNHMNNDTIFNFNRSIQCHFFPALKMKQQQELTVLMTKRQSKKEQMILSENLKC